MQFANPEYLYLLLLLIPLIAWYVVKLSKMQASFKLASTQAFKKVKPNMRVYMRHFPFVLRVISIALIIIVIARPQAVNSWEETESQGIDIVLALDVSGSMLAQDLQPNRIEAAKKVASEFVTDRKNDKIGLVIFAGESFTQCPLTTDHKVLLNLLKDVNFGMIEDGTAIGLGLANSVNRLKDSPSKSKVVILLTDGTNNRGQI
ncbi:MAG: Ca-activated chloride channel, partial [Bacteroidota bacterium]|nr:Ca-activated chloride channel [Bacteroidota bacterium]